MDRSGKSLTFRVIRGLMGEDFGVYYTHLWVQWWFDPQMFFQAHIFSTTDRLSVCGSVWSLFRRKVCWKQPLWHLAATSWGRGGGPFSQGSEQNWGREEASQVSFIYNNCELFFLLLVLLLFWDREGRGYALFCAGILLVVIINQCSVWIRD